MKMTTGRCNALDVKIIVRKMNGAPVEETNILFFSFVKDAYTPYTSLTARIFSDGDSYLSVSEILFYVGDRLIHHGLIDSLERTSYDERSVVTLVSRGFTSLLTQNQLEPGKITDISINTLMDGFYTLPYVSHEDNSDASNYIFVKNGSSMWDGIVNLSYKLYGTYPYIRDTNCVRISLEQNPAEFSYDGSSLTASGLGYNYRRRISHFHMSDLSGSYGTYELSDVNVTNRKIVRHKFFELDKQYLYNPQQALEFHDKFSNRGNFRYFCQYSGYNGEDLFDKVSFGYVSGRRITSIGITGSSKGIFTELGVYYDGFIGL